MKAKVMERDGAHCWLCGRLVVEGLAPDHPLSPSLDHVIPFAKGGTYTLDNLRLAHHSCNQERRDDIVA